MSEGFRQAGVNVIGAIEMDPAAVKAYKSNHKDVHVWESDIRDIDSAKLLEALGLEKGELDLLGGCPPCQGFSSLRTKNGRRRVRDVRNDLIYDFLELAVALRPRHIMMENVPRLLADRRLNDFKRRLEDLGYRVKADVLNVANFGVPQRRRRTVVVASRVSEPVLAAPEPRMPSIRDVIAELPRAGASGDAIHDLPERRSRLVARRISRIPKDGGGRSSLPPSLRLVCHQKSNGFNDVYGRMRWDEPAPTITTGCFNPSKGRFLHPEEDRAITMREAALLQSFPRDYYFPAELGKVAIARLIGNALPPEFIRRHTAALIGAES